MINDPRTATNEDGNNALADGFEGVVTAGLFCAPTNGTGYYADDVWHHSLGELCTLASQC